MHKEILFALAAVAAGAAAAEGRPDPLDPRAKAPPLEYRSVFEGYQRHVEPDIAPWREANEEVRSAGGHVGMMRRQAQEKPSAKPPVHGAQK